MRGPLGARVKLAVNASPRATNGVIPEPKALPDPGITARRHPMTRATLGSMLWRYPMMTGRVSAGIYAQANPIMISIRDLAAPASPAPVLVGGPGITDGVQARRLGDDGWTGQDGASALAAVEATAASART